MKYLSIIYYDTFARFFAAIEDAVKQDDVSAEFLHLAVFPSGWLYMKTLGREVRLLPWEVMKPFPKLSVEDGALDKISYYHSVVGSCDQAKAGVDLKSRAQAYVNTMGHIVEDFRPDVILFSGDTRIACESMQYYLEKSRYLGKKFFFEQGPNGTTIFDKVGVNANCSFRKLAESLTGENFAPEKKERQLRFNRNPIYRACDYALIGLLRFLNRLPPEWDSMGLKRIPKREYERCLVLGRDISKLNKSEILVALQVPDDANNIHHNPLGLADVELLKLALDASQTSGVPVRVREHPLYRRRYSLDLYALIANSDRAILSDADLEEDLARARTVVTVNSMTGLDAYLRKIPVITLGNSFYDHLPGIARVRNETDLKTALLSILHGGVETCFDGRDPARIFSEMRNKYFVHGHYLDARLVAPAAIAKIILREFNVHGS